MSKKRIDLEAVNDVSYGPNVRRVGTVLSAEAHDAMDKILLHSPLSASRLTSLLVEHALIDLGMLREKEAPLARFFPAVLDLVEKHGMGKEAK